MEKYCKQCGTKIDNKHDLCDKHYSQLKCYGFFLDDSQQHTKNEIIEYEDYAELHIYDEMLDEVKIAVKIDMEQVRRVKKIEWEYKRGLIIGKNLEGKTIALENLIVDVYNKKVEQIGDKLDFRKGNLRIVEVKEKKRKQPVVSKKNKNNLVGHIYEY